MKGPWPEETRDAIAEIKVTTPKTNHSSKNRSFRVLNSMQWSPSIPERNRYVNLNS